MTRNVRQRVIVPDFPHQMREDWFARDPDAPAKASNLRCDPMAVIRHLDHCRLRNLRPSTIYARSRALHRLRDYLDDDVALLDVDGDTMATWYTSLRMLPEGRATELSHVRGFYKWALFDGLIGLDPTARLVRPRVPRRLPRPIPDEALARALESADGRTRAILALAAFAGLRAAEIAQLHRREVLEHAVPPVLVVMNGKGGKQRVVPLAPRLLTELRETGMLPLDGYIIPRGDDLPGPIFPWLASSLANRHLRSLGITATLHQLRHWFGTELYRASRDIRLTQEVMGHASPITTAGYAAYSPGDAAVMVASLNPTRNGATHVG